MLFLQFDNNSSVRLFTFASRRYIRVLLQGRMDDLSLVRVHRFQTHMLPRLDHLCRQSVRQLLQSFLSRTTQEQKVGGVQVFFGGDGLLKDIANCSLVVARYGMQGVATGTIGVLGPMRMAYSKNIPTVRFLAGILSDLVSDSSQ